MGALGAHEDTNYHCFHESQWWKFLVLEGRRIESEFRLDGAQKQDECLKLSEYVCVVGGMCLIELKFPRLRRGSFQSSTGMKFQRLHCHLNSVV